MSGLGSLLKKARMERGITLEDLQETTKIRIRYLEAIEDEEFEVLPGSFYARAFIKSYAEAVGLNPDEVLSLYGNVIPSPQAETAPVRVKPRRRSSSRSTDRITRIASTLLVISFLGLIVYLIYHFALQEPGNPDENVANETRLTDRTTDPNAENPEPPREDPDEQPPGDAEDPGFNDPGNIPGGPVPEIRLTYVTTDSQTHIYNVEGAEQIRLELKLPAGRCWILVKKGGRDGEEIISGTYEQGQSAEWELPDSIYIRLGNPRAVELTVNGISIESDKLLVEHPLNFQFNLVTGQQQGG